MSVFASATSSAVAATPVTYFFYGYVTAPSSPGPNSPPIGSVVPISVMVDTSYPADTQLNHVTTYRNIPFTSVSPILAATIDGKNVHGDFDFVQITQNANGVYKVEVSSGSQMNTLGFDLKFTTTMTGIVRNDRIPKQIFPGNFQQAVFTATVDLLDIYSGPIVE